MTSDSTNTYKWEAENRLIEIDYPGCGNKTEFVYDGLRRNAKIIETQSGSVSSVRRLIWARFDKTIDVPADVDRVLFGKERFEVWRRIGLTP